jgi:hypothetical protein
MIVSLATSQNRKKRKERKNKKQTWVGVVIFQIFNCCVVG